jgi:hypothetical protein
MSKIQMERDDFEKEHNRLLRILREGTQKERESEAAKQEAEARKMRMKYGGVRKKVD